MTWKVLLPWQPKAMNSLRLTKMGTGRQEESKGESSTGFSGVGVEVEGPVLAALIDDGEVALGGGRDSTYGAGVGDTGVA